MKKQENVEDAKMRMKAESVSEPAKPLSRKEVEKYLRSGNLTKEQAIELRQRYMDSLEYDEDQQFVTMCGGIKPLPILPPPDEEE